MSDKAYDNVTVEEFLDRHGIEYKATSGTRGPQFNVKECPKCGGTGWKVFINQETGLGNCFHGSCGAGFTLWTFASAVLQTEDGYTIGKEFEEIAKGTGWKPKPKPRVHHPVITGQLALPAHSPLPATLPYAQQRGLTKSLIDQFELKLCLSGKFEYTKEDGSPGLMLFGGRILIPIFDLDGKMQTFQGRDILGSSEQKYLFPPRLPSTGRFLFNGQAALQNKWAHVVMGEGAFDVIQTQRAIDEDRSLVGIGAVGSFGKKLTLDTDQSQLKDLLRLKENGLHTITIMWDAEPDALKSAMDTADKLVKYGFHVRIAFLPKGADPGGSSCEMIRKSIRLALPYSRSLAIKARFSNPYA